MPPQRIAIVGGGAAGFFAALACAEAGGAGEIVILEKGPRFLAKVRISGGGRCNVTHACFDPREFSRRYPRGARELLGPFHRFQARDTVEWFAGHGVTLKAEADGRMFPVTDDAQTIVDCLQETARRAGIVLRPNCAVDSIRQTAAGGFLLALAGGGTLECARVLLATGGCRTTALGGLPVSLGHTLKAPVPSLFSFHVAVPWLRALAGVSLEDVEAVVPGTTLRERGPLLVTHEGVSGPVVLRLSAWGARELHAREYRFPLRVNWLPGLGEDRMAAELRARRERQPARLLVNAPIPPLPARLWEALVLAAGIPPETRCASLSGAAQHALVQQLGRTVLDVAGKSLNRDEFVTCGGVPLTEIDLKTMQSRVCPGLYLAGEVIDVDGITGGFNFQAAWTTGWIAGRAMAGEDG